MFKLTFRKCMHHFLNICFRKREQANWIRDTTWFAIMQCWPSHMTFVYTAVILVTSCMTTCSLQTPAKLHIRNNVYSSLVPEVPFSHLFHCIVLSVPGRNAVLQVLTAVQCALHYHRASLCLSADCTSAVHFQPRINHGGLQQFSRIQLCVQIPVMTSSLETCVFFHTNDIVYS
jgi:hypothetical protein